MPVVYEKVNVSDVADLGGLDHLGYGFAITNSHGSLLLSITYRSRDEAIAARKAVDAALTKALAVYA